MMLPLFGVNGLGRSIAPFLDHQPDGEEIPRLVECVLESLAPSRKPSLLRAILGARARTAFEQRWSRDVSLDKWKRLLDDV
jgi:hypothetical protein